LCAGTASGTRADAGRDAASTGSVRASAVERDLGLSTGGVTLLDGSNTVRTHCCSGTGAIDSVGDDTVGIFCGVHAGIINS